MAVNETRNGHTGEQLEGRVLSVNEKGLRLEGRSGWLNFSKWAEAIGAPAVTLLEALDKDGFVRTVAPSEGTDRHQSPVAGRETAITRLAVLKAATSFCAARPDLKSADLFALAERMEAWVTR
jgi:hypothetical protein